MRNPLNIALNLAATVVTLLTLAFPATAALAEDSVTTVDETNLRDKYLGQISMSGVTEAFSDRVDGFSGNLHINMVDVRLPGKGGLDLVVQRYYSSNVWNRVEGQSYLTKHSPGADPGDHLGGSGWQLHMGKLIKPTGGSTAPWTAVMPDGSTHLLYRNPTETQRISRDRWTMKPVGTTYEVTTTDGTVYAFATGLSYLDYWGNEVFQCTEIRRKVGETNGVTTYVSIQVQYDTTNQKYRRLSSVTDTYGRVVNFEYVNGASDPGEPRIQTINVKNGSNTFQTWQFAYQFQTTVNLAEGTRDIFALTSVTPMTNDTPPTAASNPWAFQYYPAATSHGSGKYCLQKVTMPTDGAISYTYQQVGFNTGNQGGQYSPVQFSVVQTRKVQDYDSAVIGVWNYAYTQPGSDGAITTVTVTDEAGDYTYLTDVSVFNGWKPYPYLGSDPDIWKVGLLRQRTVKTFRGVNECIQTELENLTYSKGALLSDDREDSTAWVGAGLGRSDLHFYAIQSGTSTRTVTRENSVGYTTTQSAFDAYGNPHTVVESVSGTQKRTTLLTYMINTDLNLLVGYVKTRNPSPGAPECNDYNEYGYRVKHVLNPASLSSCTADSSSLETDYTFSETTGDLTTETKKANGFGQDSETLYEDYTYGQPATIRVTDTNILFSRTVNPSGTIASSTDGRGTSNNYRTSYTYDALNRLTGVDPPLGLTTTFTYSPDWKTVTVTRGNHDIVYTFDGLARHISTTDQETSHKVTNTYNPLGVRIQQQLYYGTTPIDYSGFDALGRKTRLKHNVDSTEITYTYAATSGTGPKVTVKDEAGKQTVLAYEAFGDPGDTRLISVTDAAQKVTSYQYNGLNLVSNINAALAAGNRSFTYFDNLLLQTETHPESGTTTYAYDGLGNLTQKTAADSSWEQFEYDRANRLTKHLFSDSTPDVTFSYDGASQRTQMSSTDGTFDYAYDGNKNLISKQTTRTEIGSKTETLSYDTMDRLDTATYPSGRQVKYAYDDRDWVTAVNSTSGGSNYATGIQRFDNGLIRQQSLGNGAATTFTKDGRWRINAISTSSSAGSIVNLAFVYDAASNLTTWTDNLNAANSRSFTYDSLHRLTGANAANLWGNLTFQYDALGNRTSRSKTLSGQTESTTYQYTSNRLTRATTGSVVEDYEYDGRGSLSETTVSQFSVTSLVPDRHVAKPDGGANTVTVTINGSGFLRSSSATFNGFPKPTTYVSATQLTMTLTWNDFKFPNIYPVAVTNPARPDPASPQAAVSASAPFVVYFTDVPTSHPQYSSVNLIRYNEITAGCAPGAYCPDVNLKRQEMAVFILIAKHGSGYRPPACTGMFTDVPCPGPYTNWIEQLAREHITSGCDISMFCPDNPTTKAEMAVFLLIAKEGDSLTLPVCSQVFADVPCSHWAARFIKKVYTLGIDLGCGGGNYCPTQPVSRALMAQMIARTWGYQMPFVTPNPNTTAYTFNAADQLTEVQGSGGTVSFTYDGDGQRVSKTGSTGTVLYVRDPRGEVIAEYSGTGALLAEYVYLDGQRVCKVTKDANNVEHRLYYHADMLGTPVAETNEAGQLVVRSEYFPFGDEVRPGSAYDPHKFTGKELDSEIGLYYFGARYYDAHMGRFISVDPVGGGGADPQSWNRYAYARNNPLFYVDPDGRQQAQAAAMTLPRLVPLVPLVFDATFLAPAAIVLLPAAGLAATYVILPPEAPTEMTKAQLVNWGVPVSPVKTADQQGNTNPFKGPVSQPVTVVDSAGNATPVEAGQKIDMDKKTGQYRQVKDSSGRPTGTRQDGGHNPQNHPDPRAQQPHAHRVGPDGKTPITNSDGTPWLPIAP